MCFIATVVLCAETVCDNVKKKTSVFINTPTFQYCQGWRQCLASAASFAWCISCSVYKIRGWGRGWLCCCIDVIQSVKGRECHVTWSHTASPNQNTEKDAGPTDSFKAIISNITVALTPRGNVESKLYLSMFIKQKHLWSDQVLSQQHSCCEVSATHSLCGTNSQH